MSTPTHMHMDTWALNWQTASPEQARGQDEGLVFGKATSLLWHTQGLQAKPHPRTSPTELSRAQIPHPGPDPVLWHLLGGLAYQGWGANTQLSRPFISMTSSTPTPTLASGDY